MVSLNAFQPQGSMAQIQRGDTVQARMRDGSTLDMLCWFVVRDEPGKIFVCNQQNMGIAGWKRLLFRDADGTPWVHEYEEDEKAEA
jgi:hypothetical protein